MTLYLWHFLLFICHVFLQQYVKPAIALLQGLSRIDLSNPAQNDALIKGKMAVIKLI